MRITPVPDISESKKQTTLGFASILLLCGCQGVQSSLDAKGPHAAVIADIGWAMFGGATAILLLVMALAAYAIWRVPEKRAALPANMLIAAGGIALPVVTLSALLAYGVYAMAGLRIAPEASPVRIEVTGHRWWWEVHYRANDGTTITTANEIHIPAGKPVTVFLRSADVIHSFWVPSLAGKIDLVPGRTNHIVLQADRPGVFRGQCAEYCGAQHARMAFHVVAQTPADFASWLDRQAAPARAPADDIALRGQSAFSAHCASCHTVRGLSTARERGPDLSHVGSRQFLAAGTLPNTAASLADFIARSQSIKPGNGMPSHAHLGEETVAAIARYLEGLE